MSDLPAGGDGRPARGFFVSVGSLVSARAFLALSQILVLPIVARYLSVTDFALMAMAMSVVIFCIVLSDAGLGRSLIRTPTYDLDEWSSVFWLLVFVGIGLALIILAIAPLWAAFFDQPGLFWVLAALAPVPLMQAISAAPNAEIERRENYTGIAQVQMITTVVSLGLAVLLALARSGSLGACRPAGRARWRSDDRYPVIVALSAAFRLCPSPRPSPFLFCARLYLRVRDHGCAEPSCDRRGRAPPR